MKKVLILILCLFSISLAYSNNKLDNDKHVIMAKHFLNLLDSGSFEQAYNMFDSNVKSKIDVGKLKTIWSTIMFQSGKFKGYTDARKMDQKGLMIITVVCDNELAFNKFNITFDSLDRIAGFIIAGHDAKDNYKTPAYADKNKFTEKKLLVGLPGWKLNAILSLPKDIKNPPLVILVHGSGPNDMDETIGPNKPFRDLSEGLASQGIAVLRYNKRTKEHGSRFMTELKDKFTLQDETINDAVAIADSIKGISGINFSKIVVLGHSQGGYTIPAIADGSKQSSAFIIFAGSNKPLEDMLYSQYKYIMGLDGTIDATEQGFLDSLLREGKRIKALSDKSNLADKILDQPGCYWLSFNKYKPLDIITKINKPILVMQGERDYQVTMDNFTAWKKAMKNNQQAVFKSYPKLNHIFNEGSGPCTPAEYLNNGNIPKYIIDDIASWIKKLK